ncbi:MAG: alpha-D-glucose phosphate-specific phosphoglucomutase, partial [Pseudomonadota bacterium]
ANGGPAPERVTDAIYACTGAIDRYRIAEGVDPVDLSVRGDSRIGEMVVEVFDGVALYAELMADLFDFDAIRRLFDGGFTMAFDAMHAVTGPYAKHLLEGRLNAPAGTVMNGTPSPDFGGGHPDPNPTYAPDLMRKMMAPDGPDFGAASDGDGDRNMIVGRGRYVTPSDSLAVLAANAHLAPGYARGLNGVARSMPTSRATDRVASKLGVPLYETPTGWKFFGTLLDAGRATLCGEESAGTGSDHVREKDGLWAVLLWLNVIAARGRSAAEILTAHWAEYGRDYYIRHDYESVDAEAAKRLMGDLIARLDRLPGETHAGLLIEKADQFSYVDPVDGATASGQGVRLFFASGERAVLRLSGTGTKGATLRVYMERFTPGPEGLDADVQTVLKPLAEAVDAIAGVRARTGRAAPDVVT